MACLLYDTSILHCIENFGNEFDPLAVNGERGLLSFNCNARRPNDMFFKDEIWIPVICAMNKSV